MKRSILDDPDVGEESKDQLAELLADGSKRNTIAETFGVSPDTITEWRKRPDVKARVSKIVQDRADRVLSHTDTRIMKMLESGKEVSIETLLKIRQTFAGEKITVNSEGAQQDALASLLEEMDSNPALARQIAESAREQSRS